MAHTNFKHGVPYNNVRLGGDVAQWSLYEESHTNNSSFSGSIGALNISMADMQRASDTNIDPNGGRVQIGPLATMRYGIAVLGDVSTGDDNPEMCYTKVYITSASIEVPHAWLLTRTGSAITHSSTTWDQFPIDED